MVEFKIYTARRSKDSFDNLFNIYRNIKKIKFSALCSSLQKIIPKEWGKIKLALYTGDKEVISPFWYFLRAWTLHIIHKTIKIAFLSHLNYKWIWGKEKRNPIFAQNIQLQEVLLFLFFLDKKGEGLALKFSRNLNF
jgi:hypothetical protein